MIDGKTKDAFLNYFLERYKNDIQIYFPEFNMEKAQIDQVYIVCCDGTPAGVLLGKQNGDDVIEITIDYSIPAYRDCSIGTFLYSKLQNEGIRTLTFAQKESETHVSYMKKMGFVKEHNTYVKKLY